LSRKCLRLMLFVPAAALLCLLFSPVLPRQSDALALSIQEEQKLGEEFLAQIRKSFVILNDDSINRYINNLGQYLTSAVETRPFPFHFYVIKDNTLNAFAAPGGHVFIFSGLVNEMKSADELAAVLTHEIGHVAARHLSHRIEKSQKINLATMAGVLAGVLVGAGPVAEALMAGSMAAGVQAELHYSREDERQADQMGFKYMTATGFDPAGMISTLNTIEKDQWLGTDKIPAYLLTHPTGPERISNLESMVSGYHPDPSKNTEPKRFEASFSFFKTMVQAESLDPYEAEKLFKAELEKSPKALLPQVGLGMVYMKRSEYDLAIEHFEKALEGGAAVGPVLRDLGEAYQMKGQDRKAVSVLEKALEADDADGSTLFLLAISYENLEQHEKAIQVLERLAAFPPVKTEVYYHLGMSYGKENRLALAHYNFGIYFKKSGQIEKSRFHFRKAEELAKGDPALTRKIEEAAHPEGSHYSRGKGT
jgi:predicted Zn-dependent protease